MPQNPVLAEFEAIAQRYVTPDDLAIPQRLAFKKDFKHVVYNMRDRSDPREFVKPLELDDSEWLRAVNDNPDDNKLVPVPVIGFEGLLTRVGVQDGEMQGFVDMSKELRKGLEETERAALADEARLQQIRRRHREQSHRLMTVMEKVDCVLSREKSLDPQERRARNKLDEMLRRLNRPTEFKARLNELVALHRMQDDRAPPKAYIEDHQLRLIMTQLEAQREALEHLIAILRRDERDLGIMLREDVTYREVGGGGVDGLGAGDGSGRRIGGGRL